MAKTLNIGTVTPMYEMAISQTHTPTHTQHSHPPADTPRDASTRTNFLINPPNVGILHAGDRWPAVGKTLNIVLITPMYEMAVSRHRVVLCSLMCGAVILLLGWLAAG